MSLKLAFLLLCSFVSSLSFGFETSNHKDSCALTLRSLNVIKISNREPLEVKPLPTATKIDIFSNLSKLDPVKPLLSVKLSDREAVVAIRDMQSLQRVNGQWTAITHNNQTDLIVRFTDGTQTYLSEIKSIQLLEWPSVQIVISNPLKTARFVFTQDEKIEDTITRLAEGNPEAMSFLMDVVSHQMRALEAEEGQSVTEADQRFHINHFMMLIASHNIGGDQLVKARDLYSGSDDDRAREFVEALFFEPGRLVDGINQRAPMGYPHRAQVPLSFRSVLPEP